MALENQVAGVFERQVRAFAKHVVWQEQWQIWQRLKCDKKCDNLLRSFSQSARKPRKGRVAALVW